MRNSRLGATKVWALVCALGLWTPLFAQEAANADQAIPDEQETALAKKSQNPIGDLIGLPLQWNNSFNLGEHDRTRSVVNVQPVVPVKLGSFNIINRTIVPVMSQPDLTEPSGSTFGIGDITHTAFFTPATPGKVKPIFAAGNSDGDLQMLQYTDDGRSATFALYVHHVDAEREWAYDRESSIGKLDAGLDEAAARGWTVVSMRDDWNVHFRWRGRVGC